MRRRGVPQRHSRRQLITAAGLTLLGGLAGCLGDDSDRDGHEDHDAHGNDDGHEDHDDHADGDDDTAIGAETEALAEQFVDALESDREVLGWGFNGDLFVPDFREGENLEDDVELLGEAYADIVREGFDHRAMPSAYDADDEMTYMVFLEVDWATEYLEGERSIGEYHEAILDSEH